MKALNPVYLNIIIALLAACLFVPLLGAVPLFDWDEINFAESAREMLLSGDYSRVQINYQPFWEKPPLFIWLQALSMHFFGVNEFAARFPNALIGIATILVLFNIGRKHFDLSFGIFWSLVYACSFLPHLYFKSGIIDPGFNLFIFLGIYFLSRLSSKDSAYNSGNLYSLLSVTFIGLAILTKGPVALLIVMLSVLLFIIIKRKINVFSFKHTFLFFLAAGIISFAWFGLETIKNGPWFLQEFIVYQIRLFRTQDAGHGGPFFYHFLVLYIGCFPASIFIFKAMRKYYLETREQASLKLWMLISFFVVLILFSIVKTKIVHYSSFCYFPLSFLAAYGITKLMKRKTFLSDYFKLHILIIGGLISLLIFLLPLLMKYKDNILPGVEKYIKDDFALANLRADVHWSGWECLIGVFYFIVIIYAALNIKRGNGAGIYTLFIGTAICIQLTLYLIVPKIERFSQGAAIDFFKSISMEKAYVDVLGYKSYAQYFYAKVPPRMDSLGLDKNRLLHGNVDLPVYLVSKITNKDSASTQLFKKIGEKNGFLFWKRNASSK